VKPARLLLSALLASSALAAPRADADDASVLAGVAAQVRAGHPLVVYVVIPLCSNAQIDCGSPLAGRLGDLDHNLYWGAAFGARRFFERPRAGGSA
jgi:hypothetical protein